MEYVEGTYFLKKKTLRRPIRGRVEEHLKSDYYVTITIPVKFTEVKFLLSSSQKSLEKILPSFGEGPRNKTKTNPKKPKQTKMCFQTSNKIAFLLRYQDALFVEIKPQTCQKYTWKATFRINYSCLCNCPGVLQSILWLAITRSI